MTKKNILKGMKSLAAAAASLALLATAACGGKASEESADGESYIPFEEAQEQFASQLSASDTTAVLALGAELMDSLKARNIDFALDHLSMFVNGHQIAPLSDEMRKELTARFKRFPVVSYELDYYDFSLPVLNDLKYRVAFREAPEGGKAPTMAFMLNPVRTDEGWVLVVKDGDQPARDAANALHPQTPIIVTPEAGTRAEE